MCLLYLANFIWHDHASMVDHIALYMYIASKQVAIAVGIRI